MYSWWRTYARKRTSLAIVSEIGEMPLLRVDPQRVRQILYKRILPVYLVTAAVEARNQVESDDFTGILLKPVSLDNLKALLGQ